MTDNNERWRPIPGFSGYDVSDRGRVRSYYARTKGRPPGQHWVVSKSPQRILSTGARFANRYPCCSLRDDRGNVRPWPVHRLIMLAFVGPCPDGLQVCHNDDNPEHNHLSNLRYDTQASNIRDIITCRGRAGRPPMPDDTILAMRQARNRGVSTRELAKRYDLHQSHIASICYGHTYPNAPGPTNHPPTQWTPHKLTDAQVIEIRQRLASNSATGAALAREYGVSESMISRIKNGTRRNGTTPKEQPQP